MNYEQLTQRTEGQEPDYKKLSETKSGSRLWTVDRGLKQ